MRITVSFLLGVFLVSNALGALTLEELKQQLATNGASWTAGESDASKLSDEDKRSRLGFKFESEDSYFDTVEGNDANADLPESLDWRNFEGKNWTTPVKDQGHCGSCLSFSATAVLEAQANITYKNPNSPWSFSPQYAFACAKGLCEEGLMPTQILKQLKDVGTVDESCMPYTSGAIGEDVACSARCKDYKDRTFKIEKYESYGSMLFGTDTNKVKKALLTGPVLAGMVVYEDFYYYKGGVYKHVTGKELGGHAVAIVGWENSTKSWIVQNSWSPTWGEKGFFRIAWKDSAIASAAYGLRLPTATKYVAFENVHDYQVLSGKTKLTVASNLTDLQKVNWSFSKDEKTALDGAVDVKGKEREVIVDTTTLEDGTYTLNLAGHTRNGITLQQPKIVSILNGKMTGTLLINNIKPEQEFTDKIDLDIRVETKPIRLSEVTFLVKNKSTGEIAFERSASNVGPKMLMGLRKGALTDGAYDFILQGSVNGKVQLVSQPVAVKVKAKK